MQFEGARGGEVLLLRAIRQKPYGGTYETVQALMHAYVDGLTQFVERDLRFQAWSRRGVHAVQVRGVTERISAISKE